MFECFGVLKLDLPPGGDDDGGDGAWSLRVRTAFAAAQSRIPDLFEPQDLRWRNAQAAIMVFHAHNRDCGQVQEIEAFAAELACRGVNVAGMLTVRHIEDDDTVHESRLTISAYVPSSGMHSIRPQALQ